MDAGCFDPIGGRFFVTLGSAVEGIDPQDLRTTCRIAVAAGVPRSVAVSHDGKRLAVGTLSRRVVVLDIASGLVIAVIKTTLPMATADY